MALSITRAQAADIAYSDIMADGAEESGLTVPEVEEMIDEAAYLTCERIKQSEKYYRLHDGNISISVSGGIGIIPADVMVESMRDSAGGEGTMTSLFTGTLKFLPDPAKLRLPRPGGTRYGYYSLRGGSGAGALYVFDASGAGVTGTATFRAARYYTFSTLPAQLEDEFLRALKDMVKERLSGQSSSGQEGAIVNVRDNEAPA